MSSYYRNLFTVPFFTREEERKLILEYRVEGSQRAKEKLVTGFMKLVISMAKQYKKKNTLPMHIEEDLISEGAIGLTVSLDKFDIDRVCEDGSYMRFATCARLWISAYMMTALMNSYSQVHKVSASSTLKTVFFNLNKKMKSRGFTYPLTHEEIGILATDMGVTVADVNEIIIMRSSFYNLDDPVYEGSSQVMDVVSYETSKTEEEYLSDIETKEVWTIFQDACDGLTDRERDILKTRTYAETPEKLEQLANRYGITKERVRQIEKRANEKAIRTMKKRIGRSI